MPSIITKNLRHSTNELKNFNKAQKQPPLAETYMNRSVNLSMNDALMDLGSKGKKVFPATANKLPARGIDWKTQYSSDIKKMYRWPVDYQNMTIGFPCGSVNNIMVINIDTPQGHGEKATGIESIRELKKTLGFETNTLIARTPSSGYHLFYYYVESVKNSVYQIGAGLEVLSEDSYVIIAPSVTVAGLYQWFDKFNKPTSSPDFNLVNTIPDVFLNHILLTQKNDLGVMEVVL